MKVPILLASAVAALLLVAGCATDKRTGASTGPVGAVTVRIEPDQLAPEARGLPRIAKVELSDIRQTVHNERTTIGDVSMGRIAIEPDELEIVRALVQAKADALLARQGRPSAPTIYAGLHAFQVETPATLLYWDVTARIELVLRAGEEDRTAAATQVERTYLWPTKALIQRVTSEALRRLSSETEKALAELLGGR